MKIIRRKSRVVKIGSVYIGGKHPVAVQSMSKIKTSCVQEVIGQVKLLEKAGCRIVRVAVEDRRDAAAIRGIKRGIKIPLVADIHFDWRLALAAVDNGADKIRLNPGNIYKKEEVREVAAACRANRIPIRVGVNSGSLRVTGKRRVRADDGLRTTDDISIRMVNSALAYIRLLESFKFRDIVVSLKASNILDTIAAYRRIAVLCDYPLHLGVTATGLPSGGTVKSAIAIGSLLLAGIGDTIRVSLTGVPAEEVRAGQAILEALGLGRFGPEVISCPTCGRCRVNLSKMVRDLEVGLSTIDHGPWTRPLKAALMGCVVNGPGEAKDADIGIAFGKSAGLLFKNGRPVKKVSFGESVQVLCREIAKL